MIFVIADHKDNRLKPITNELIVFAQKVAKDFNQPVAAVVMASSAGSIADELKTRKIDRVITVEDPALAEYDAETYVRVLSKVFEGNEPFLVVAGHTTQGVDFMPRLAAVLRRPLIAGCVD